MKKGLYFDIKRYAINDGPGIRVVVFFKGCNLHCAWCHNPESISPEIEKMYSLKKCIMCGECVSNCPERALKLTPEGVITDREVCTLCGKCAEVCPTKAIEMSGYHATVDEIINIIEKERIFFDQSGGGVTFSGGEPILQSETLIELLDECGKRGIHRAVDTAGMVKTETLLEVAKRTDLFLFDLKMMNTSKHKEWIRTFNEKILENLKALAETGARIFIRIPLIGGVNDDEDNILQTAQFVSKLAGEPKEVNLIPYHHIAQPKYTKLGRPDEFIRMAEPTKERMAEIIDTFGQYGIKASIGG